MKKCEICRDLYGLDQDGVFFREFVSPSGFKARKYICLFHEMARRRLVLFRRREARAIDRSAHLTLDPVTKCTVAHQVQ